MASLPLVHLPPSLFPRCGGVAPRTGRQRGGGGRKRSTMGYTQRLTLSPLWLCFLPVNDFRTARVAEVLSDFQNIQYYIAASPVNPPNMDDYYTEGWTALRQCSLDGQRILNCGADTSVPETSGGPEEQAKAELKQSVRPLSISHFLPPFPNSTPDSPYPRAMTFYTCTYTYIYIYIL